MASEDQGNVGRQQAMASADDVEDELAVLEFHEYRGGVRGLVESGVTTVPPLFLTPTGSVPAASAAVLAPTVDLSLPRPHVVALIRAAARSCGMFQVTNHGVPAGTVDSALAAVRAFNEQPFAARTPFYSFSPDRAITYFTVPIPRPKDVQPPATPLMSWRDSLIARFDHQDNPYVSGLPESCRDALLRYHWSLTWLGKEIAGLLVEGLGVGAERLEQVEGCLLQCHYHPPCPEPERVLGSREHTDADLFTVLSQDGVGGLQVRLDDGQWVDVVPVTGTLLVNIGDLLQVISNDEYKSIEHRVVIKSTQEPRISVALFFNPAKHGHSDFFAPLPELVTAKKPARYRSLTWMEMLDNRVQLWHGKPSTLDRFKTTLN